MRFAFTTNHLFQRQSHLTKCNTFLMKGTNSYKFGIYNSLRDFSNSETDQLTRTSSAIDIEFSPLNSMVHWIQNEKKKRKKEIDRKIWNIFIAAYVHNIKQYDYTSIKHQKIKTPYEQQLANSFNFQRCWIVSREWEKKIACGRWHSIVCMCWKCLWCRSNWI